MPSLNVAGGSNVHAGTRALADGIIRDGGVAVIGRILAWDTLANDFRIRRDGLLLTPITPPLANAHPGEDPDGTYLIGDGRGTVHTPAGVECVWELRNDVTSITKFFEYVFDGHSGLSMDADDTEHEYNLVADPIHGVVREHDGRHPLTVRSVALAASPAFDAARILAIGTPVQNWEFDSPERGVLPLELGRVGSMGDYLLALRDRATRYGRITPPAILPAGSSRAIALDQTTGQPVRRVEEIRAAHFDELDVNETAGGRIDVEGICVPFNRVTRNVAGPPEQFRRGAFATLVASNARIKLIDYNHSPHRIPVGYSTALEERPEGLWARFRLNNTPEGESARANIAAGVYGGLSIGFLAETETMIGGVRTITGARLHHVSLVESPAYDDAQITALRPAA